jgi:hypothetical protein
MASRYRAPPGRASGAADNQDRAAGMSGEHGREDVDCINSACPPCRSCTGPHSRSSGRQPPPRSAPPRPRALPLPTARRPRGAARSCWAGGACSWAGSPTRHAPRACISPAGRSRQHAAALLHPAAWRTLRHARRHHTRCTTPPRARRRGPRARAAAPALRHPRGADPGGGCRVSARTALCTSLAPLHGARRAAETSGTPT